jgi:two-component system LytT family response regulator
MQIIGESQAWSEELPYKNEIPGSQTERNGILNPRSGSPSEKIRTVIADDQLMACEMLRRLLKDEEDIEIIATPSDGAEAVDIINRLQPDLVFLDIKMPGLDGFDVIKHLHCPRLPAIIFVTGNEDFATKAFEVHALDYLVKPCDPERFQTALHRARSQIRRQQTSDLTQKLNALLADLQIRSKPAERIPIKSNGHIVFLSLLDVDWIEAADNYVVLHSGQESHLLRETMTRLESKLPVEHFLRISRSTIINIDRIRELHPLFHGEYVVVLRNGKRLTLTRTYREKLHQLGVA